jgi:hypothetical protein
VNVLLLHLDGKLPNLALMRLHAHLRAQGHTVELRQAVDEHGYCKPAELQPRLGDPQWDRVYGSLIFQRTKPEAELARRIYPGVELGGTGWDFDGDRQVRKTDLPDDVESTPPDYSGYPSFTASIGFAQRGCRFACTFCVVPRKEGKVKSVSGLEAIWRGAPHPSHVILLDNDFFGNPNWREIIGEAKRLGLAIAVIQGINARLLSDEQAAAIASVRWMSDDFERRRVYTAWDLHDDERTFFRGLDRLKAHGISPDSILVYMLIGYADGENHADRDYRRAKLRAYGARPYPMPYTRTGELGEELVAFQSWCIQRKDVTDPATGKPYIPWEIWWGKVRGNVRKLGSRRVSLPLFRGDE